MNFYDYPYSLNQIIITIANKSLHIKQNSFTKEEFYDKINYFIKSELSQTLDKNSKVIVRVIPNSKENFEFFTLYELISGTEN